MPFAAFPLAAAVPPLAAAAQLGGAPTLESVLRTTLPVAAAIAAAWTVVRVARRRGETGPGLEVSWRRAVAGGLLAAIFYLGVFFAFSTLGQEVDLDLSAVRPWEIFSLHAVLVAGLLAWGLLAFAGTPSLARRIAAAFRLAEEHPWREIGVGLLAGGESGRRCSGRWRCWRWY